ncbi:hypothetical protein AQUCO_00600036v1 [Aquilegia coerulea]|uniref:Uncharacterized protein n=1 Tax=Aquilegia coerulea TaxID=218851 RepID=A0A2G5EMV9_AQUCA|nr:hypothetical protein AQUCO_00600036v1 [Aquilegia coerulea]
MSIENYTVALICFSHDLQQYNDVRTSPINQGEKEVNIADKLSQCLRPSASIYKDLKLTYRAYKCGPIQRQVKC